MDYVRSEYLDKLRPAPEIAKELGITQSHMYRLMHRNGIPVRTKAQAMQLARAGRLRGSDVETEVCKMYESGYSSNEVAVRLRLGKTDVFNILSKNGVRVRTRREAAITRRNASTRSRKPARKYVGETTECCLCGADRFLEVHHLNGDASDNHPSNLVALCWEHHTAVEFFITRAICGYNRRMAIQPT